jgi:hypothetical protein
MVFPFLRRWYNVPYFLWLYGELIFIQYNIKIAELDCIQIKKGPGWLNELGSWIT